MKYVLFVVFTFMTPDGEIDRTKFAVDMESREICLAAQQSTETELLEKYPNALALTTECRPETPWDEPVALRKVLER